MDKDVLSAIHANKPEPLAIIKPLDSAFALHTALLSCHTSPTVPRPPCQASVPEKAPYESAEQLRVCIYHSPSRVSSGSLPQFALPQAFQYNCRRERFFSRADDRPVHPARARRAVCAEPRRADVYPDDAGDPPAHRTSDQQRRGAPAPAETLPPAAAVLLRPDPADGLSDRVHQRVQPAVLGPGTHRNARDGGQGVAPPPLRPSVFVCSFSDDPHVGPIRPALDGPVPQEDGAGHAARPSIAGTR